MASLQTILALCLFGLMAASLAEDTAQTEQDLQRQAEEYIRKYQHVRVPAESELKAFCQGCNSPLKRCSLYVQMTSGRSLMATGFSWLKPLSGSGECAKQGVLQLDPPSWANSLTLWLTFSEPTAWSFNLGDSESNNGYGGDSGNHTNGYAAEIHNTGNTLHVFKNDLPDICHHCEKMYVLNDVITSKLIIRVSHDQLCIYNGDGVTVFKVSKCLFNFDRMFLGLNRVIHSEHGSPSKSRDGSGLCSVCGSWSSNMVTDP